MKGTNNNKKKIGGILRDTWAESVGYRENKTNVANEHTKNRNTGNKENKNNRKNNKHKNAGGILDLPGIGGKEKTKTNSTDKQTT